MPGGKLIGIDRVYDIIALSWKVQQSDHFDVSLEAVLVGSHFPGASSPCKQLSFLCLVLLLVMGARDRKICMVAVLNNYLT